MYLKTLTWAVTESVTTDTFEHFRAVARAMLHQGA